MRQPGRHWYTSVAFTAVLAVLLSAAVAGPDPYFLLVTLPAIVVGPAIIYFLFPGSRFFSIALANFIAVYSSIFIFFIETNFLSTTLWVRVVSFLLPVLAFIVGVVARREAIRRIVTAERVRDERHIGRIMVWLIPVFAIGATTFLLQDYRIPAHWIDIALGASMAAIGVIVFLVSRDVATFLIDTGLLFEEFFARIAQLLVPAFAFLTFYSMTIIVFAAIYRIIDRFSATTHFFYRGEAHEITFSDALYFSIITLSTVGYGDLVPASPAIRVITAVEIVIGVLLLLFGFNEIFRYSRERPTHRRQQDLDRED